MRKKLRRVARDELLGALRERHSRSSKQGKGLILDEMVALSGCNRNYAVQLLGKGPKPVPEINKSTRRRINDEAVKEALIVIWEASNRFCGKPLKAVLPQRDRIARQSRSPATGPGTPRQTPGDKSGHH